MNELLKNKLNKFLGEMFNIVVLNYFPRHSVRFARSYFKDNPIKVIEVGTYEGFNALNMLKVLNIKEMVLIDPYKEYSDYLKSEKNKVQEKLDLAKEDARYKMNSHENVRWIYKNSKDAINDLKGEYDFIYIDGNHEYEYVKEDMENYWKLVKNGGILAGHDIASFPGVAKAFVEFCSENGLVPNITRTDWWVIKKEEKTK